MGTSQGDHHSGYYQVVPETSEGRWLSDGRHKDRRQLDMTISVRVSLSEVAFAKYSLPLTVV